jgi:hypothetical protein
MFLTPSDEKFIGVFASHAIHPTTTRIYGVSESQVLARCKIDLVFIQAL